MWPAWGSSWLQSEAFKALTRVSVGDAAPPAAVSARIVKAERVAGRFRFSHATGTVFDKNGVLYHFGTAGAERRPT